VGVAWILQDVRYSRRCRMGGEGWEVHVRCRMGVQYKKHVMEGVGWVCIVQDGRRGMRGAGCSVQDEVHAMGDVGWKVRDGKCRM
jgi:hypothetical protein